MTSIPSVNIFSGGSSWLDGALSAIKSSQSPAGILGALQATNDGSVSSFLSNTQSAANALATVSTNSVTSASALYAQMASQNDKKRQQDQLTKAMQDLQATQNMVQPTNVLDDYVYFGDGSYIDTKNNITTMSDGTQIDNTTGTEVVDSSSIMQLANGAYLNTKTSVMTMSDGTKIDTVTGLKI